MEYRTLGKTGLKISVLSYGASPLGGVFGQIDESEGIRTVHTALDLGINFIDVSPFYGLTKAEMVLGKALKTIPRDRYYLATKVGRYGASEFDFSAQRVKASIDESLARLQVDYVDLLQCHDIEFGSLDQVVNETLPVLRDIQQQGKARFIGISGLPLKIFRYVTERSEVDTILSYARCCLLDTSLESLIPEMRQKNIGVINASALSMGLLTNEGAPDWHPASDAIKRCCTEAAAYCRSQGADIAKLALQFSLSRPNIATTLVGAAKPEYIIENVRSMESSIDDELLSAVQAILKPVRNQIWPSGRPENRD